MSDNSSSGYGLAQAGSEGYFDDGGFPVGGSWDEISLPEIGDGFGGRDHTTVLHGCRVIRDLMQSDGKLREDWDKLVRKLTE